MTQSPINRVSTLLAAALMLSGLVQCQGQGTMQVGFEGQMNRDARYYESGMWFGGLNPGPEVLWIASSGLTGFPDDGTQYLRVPGSLGLEFGFSSSTLFNLDSLDLAENHISVPGPVTVHVVGYRPQYEIAGTVDLTTDGINDGPGGLPDFQTFSLDSRFQNLWRVQITTSSFSLDNVSISGVPEPSTGALVLLAAACAFGRSRIKRRRS
jgi:hypothetical protein